MKRILKGVAVLAAVAAFSAAPAHAQAKVGVAGTGLFSLESGGGSQFGGMAMVGFGGVNSPIGFRVDGTFSKKDGVTAIIGTGDITYAFKTAESSMFHPYLLAGGGIQRLSGGGASLTKPLAKVGAGFDYMMGGGKMALFAEPTFNLAFMGEENGGTSKFLQTNVGVKFNLGK
ncbi:MAG TPA: hypothetical protein VFS40_12155 [Gemmatimonadales bacterium]|nr:hypothetical protein [Gemmatimonadales bacterium]